MLLKTSVIASALESTATLGLAADAMAKGSRDKSSGWYWLVQGFKEMGLGGVFGGWVGYQGDAIQRMHEMSPEARMQTKNVSKEVREMMGGAAIGRRRGARSALSLPKLGLFHFARAMKQTVSGVAWWGAYHQAMNGHAGFDVAGLTDAQMQEKAIAYAVALFLHEQDCRRDILSAGEFRQDFFPSRQTKRGVVSHVHARSPQKSILVITTRTPLRFPSPRSCA